ncbi:Teichuronic acid biosynthesis protein TuaB [Bacillus glycinifermentans]|uniref:teichuronic acid biosynthesis protein TuaB n=1 Tax=Bacillus glycinifermentans TaxID=1664069 RepID=UPI000654B5E6|nr:MOP flippase family protein [Bacillus glycinifermentans]KMM58511.1 Teichuronic acid biosynthesis protein TuaB [Bacillus glycinifermentans]MEC0494195.1 MOP flippase family protein [Bacillus glycinifermentans]MEC0540610.1 MOP flippase family protein [Bacillus glycinifermentans]
MSTITKQILNGAKWTSASTLIITVIQIVQFALLGNMMTIAEFGLVGMLTTFTVFTQIVLDMGFGAALIQKETVNERQLSTLYWLNIITGMALFAGLFFLSPVIAGFYQRDELVLLIRILAVMFLIAPVGQQYQYLLQKELRFQVLSKIEAGANALSFVLLIVLIFLIDPILAYVLSQVFLNSFKGIMFFAVYLKKWRPSFVFAPLEVKDFFSFGAFQLASRLVNRLGANIDMILIGRFLGAEALGIYNLAYQIITIPVMRINPIITRVAFPVFSKNQSDNTTLREGFLNMTKLLALASFPLLIGLATVSDLFIEVVFGEKWLPAVPVLNILAIVGLLRVLMNPNGSVLLAKGRADLAFYWDSGILVLYGLTLYAAVLTKDLTVAAWTYAAISLINFFIGRWLLKYVIELKLGDYFKTIGKPLALTALMAVLALFLSAGTRHLLPEAVLQLAVSVGISAVFYGFLVGKVYRRAVRAQFSRKGG